MIDCTYADCFVNAVESFKNQRLSSCDGSERAWEHCTLAFHDARKGNWEDKLDYLALQLGMYLANFGMYRSTILLSRHDYTIHKGAVEIILNRKYDSLDWISCAKISDEENGVAFEAIVKELREHYEIVRKRTPGNNPAVTDTHITKVLMGTLCCTPAYDTYVANALRGENPAQAEFSLASVRKLAQLYPTLTRGCVPPKMVDENGQTIDYPQMRVLDIGLWQIGFQSEEKEERERA